MGKQSRRRREQRANSMTTTKKKPRQQPPWLGIWSVTGVIIAAVIAVGVLVYFNTQGTQGGEATDGQNQLVGSLPDVPMNGYVLGDPNAPVTVDEWGDFQCPSCLAFTTGASQNLEQTYIKQGKVKLVWHNYPILGQESIDAANASACAKDQGKFWPYHDKLYSMQGQENSGVFTKDKLKQYAKDVGLDSSQFDSCVDGNKHQSDVQQSLQQGQNLQVQYTPTLFINGQKAFEGTPSWTQLQGAIEKALAK